MDRAADLSQNSKNNGVTDHLDPSVNRLPRISCAKVSPGRGFHVFKPKCHNQSAPNPQGSQNKRDPRNCNAYFCEKHDQLPHCLLFAGHYPMKMGSVNPRWQPYNAARRLRLPCSFPNQRHRRHDRKRRQCELAQQVAWEDLPACPKALPELKLWAAISTRYKGLANMSNSHVL